MIVLLPGGDRRGVTVGVSRDVVRAGTAPDLADGVELVSHDVHGTVVPGVDDLLRERDGEAVPVDLAVLGSVDRREDLEVVVTAVDGSLARRRVGEVVFAVLQKTRDEVSSRADGCASPGTGRPTRAHKERTVDGRTIWVSGEN